jgi:hypothetical protein
MSWAGHVARFGEEKGVHRVLVGKPEGKKDIDGRIILRWIFRKLEGGTGWRELAQDRDRWRVLVSTVKNLRVPLNAGNFLTSCKPVSFSRRTVLHGVSQ